MRDAVAAAGGEATSLRVICNVDAWLDARGVPDPAATLERLQPLHAAGATDFVLHHMPPIGRADEAFEHWVDEFRLAFGTSPLDGAAMGTS
jgi:hypothetical protein